MKRELALLFLMSFGVNTIASSAAVQASSPLRFVSVPADSTSTDASAEEPSAGSPPAPVFNVEVLRLANRIALEVDVSSASFNKTFSGKTSGGLWITGNLLDALE